jgi:signal transduction histidine kinase
MGQVLRHDLAMGRLLALEEDLPDLIEAADQATDSVRTVVRSLQESSLGSAGLPEMLRLLVDQVRQESDIAIQLSTPSKASGSALTQLLIFQVAREAVRNAVAYSGAAHISVVLEVRDDTGLVLEIQDDGRGFVPSAVDRNQHFGLELIRERVELAGGTLILESSSIGTRLVARIPSGPDK